MRIELEQEVDGRWIAEVMDLPGVLVYADDQQEAVEKVKGLALRVLTAIVEQGKAVPEAIVSHRVEESV